MKKILVMLLVIGMCFSLIACGDNSEVEKYKKYETLIAYMEAEDYESALAEVVEMSNGSVYIDNTSDVEETTDMEETTNTESVTEEEELGEEEPEVEAIEITLDNWQEYFEIVERDKVIKNAFDEITDVVRVWDIVIKDGFEMVEYDIAVEYSFIYEMRYYEIDKEDGTLTIGEYSGEGKFSDTMNKKISSSVESNLIFTSSAGNKILYFPTDLQIVRIQGTLNIVK